ncbi:gastrula zinc finger protein xFG20-1-like [Entelurus aequoreus]|uniref:gastrula zinc finger protein xFG20-1-like n=1 Tax=Entelurus aequoreus TaxID=161455 RepID=UPI002B1E23E6|nr:gastrula zinc finger protein xFG20-1-like [Entelurus aequoreus]
MCKVQKLRVLMEQRLNAAVEEICALLERTMAEYEEELSRTKEEKERQSQVLEPLPQPCVDNAGLQQVSVKHQEVQSEQQEGSSNVGHSEPEPPHFKVEKVDVWAGHDQEQLQGPEEVYITNFPFTGIPVKSDEDTSQSSQLQHSQSEENRRVEFLDQHMTTGDDGELYGGSEGDLLAPLSDIDDMMSHSSETNHHDPTEPLESNTHFICTECGKTFATMKSLRLHARTHIQHSDRVLSCPQCEKMFATKKNLNRHMITHTGARPFDCSVCGNKFSRSHHLKRHMKVHTGEKLFPCSVCTKRFLNKGDMVAHMKTHKQEQALPCLICAKGFSKKCHLERHIRTHTGEKPFCCTVCDKRFSRREHIKLHKCTGDSRATT